MVTTSPDNLWSPNATDPYNLTTDLATMQTSVQNALTPLKTYRTDLTNAQRLALTGAALFEGLRVWTSDTKEEWLYTNGGWINPSQVIGWQTLSAAPGWSANTGGNSPQVALDGKIALYRGGLYGGAANTTATTLPTWARPTREIRKSIMLSDNLTFGVARIYPSGIMQLAGAVSSTAEIMWSVI